MHKILRAACLFCFPLLTLGQVPAPGLSCQITADKRVYKVDEEPLIAIRILNNTDSVVQLVKVLDGSESQMRFPQLYYEVYKLSGSTSKKIKPPLVIRCGNMDGIQAADFVAVVAGQSFNPLGNQSEVYTSGVSLASWIRKRGHYKVVFHYSTNQSDFKQWLGDMASTWFDWPSGEILPSKREAYENLATLFSKVPKVAVVSNELLVDFQ